LNILTIETTCDETAAAVVTDQLAVLSSVVASQDELHRRFGGVVPEIASRAHLERILPVIDEALRRAKIQLAEVGAVAVANQPGLAGSLLVGVTAAKTLSLALGIPLVAINHLQAHVYACRMEFGPQVFPCVALVVSGGHTTLYRCLGPLDFTALGGTIDDAAGEAFDKVATMLGLPYPGGPSIELVAARGNSRAYDFPRSLVHDERLDFSFSGLKTAVRYAIAGQGAKIDPNTLDEQTVANLAASFQAAVVDCLVAKSLQAIQKTGLDSLCVAGGVAANRTLRGRLEEECRPRKIALYVPSPMLCTDNAVMGAIAVERLRAGLVETLDLDAHPGLVRDARLGGNETKNPRSCASWVES
jgi:N6-L-threonylcarbamoyladenine synthase